MQVHETARQNLVHPRRVVNSPATPGSPTQHSEQESMKTILRIIRYHYAMWRHQRKFGKFPPMGF